MIFINKISNQHFILRLFWLLLFGLALPGCSFLDPGPPPSFYTLNLDLPPVQVGPQFSRQLAVVLPDSGDMLSSNRIATQFQSGEVQFWANAAWSSPAPNLIQRKLVEAFEATEIITAMPQDSMGHLADFRLVSDLRNFTVVLDEADNPAFVQVRLAARIIDLRSGKSIALIDNPKQAPVNAGSIQGVIAAYNQATAQAVNEIVLWTIEVLQKNSHSNSR